MNFHSSTMSETTWTLLAIFASIIFYLYVDYKRKCGYWKKRGVPYPKSQGLARGIATAMTTDVPQCERLYSLYKEFPGEKMIGVYSLSRPMLLVRDPAILERIMVKDFQYFTDHDAEKVDKSTILNLGLFNLTGNEWRSYRSKISPTFTTGKLKNMFDELLPCGDNMIKNIKNMKNHNIKEDIMSFAIDVTSSVIFGIEFKNKELRENYKNVSENVFKLGYIKGLLMMVASQFQSFAKFAGIKFLDQEHEDFFRNIITQTFAQRSGGFQRNDYVQLLLKLKEMGHLEVKHHPDDDYLKSDIKSIQNYEVSDQILAAQAFQFITAGFEPIVHTMSSTLIELAQNKEIQEKVRKEIKEKKAKHGGYTYAAVRDMEYLEQCINETLRKHPVLPFLMRYCLKDYPLTDKYTIEKNTNIMVSVTGIHRDPAYYPDPDKFDPDRFGPDAPQRNFTYLPFGAGPRVCIGMRFAMMEMKFGLASIVENFEFDLGSDMKIPFEFDPNSFFIAPVKASLNLTPIKS